MARYPIRLRRDTTRSSKPRKQAAAREFNRTAEAIETHINTDFADAPEHCVRQYMHVNLARELHLNPDVVCRALMSVGGGSNGITVVKGDLDAAIGYKAGVLEQARPG